MSQFELTMGLEVHVQLLSDRKLFAFEACPQAEGFCEENHFVSPISLGYPGHYPVFNFNIIESVQKVAFLLSADINPVSHFERKNYFYPDLPKGYQITQNRSPILLRGEFEYFDGVSFKQAKIHHAHLEEDAGKSIYEFGMRSIDYNRAGVPLLEIVTDPCFRSKEEVVGFLRFLRLSLVDIGVCDGRMEEGSFRFDCNVSLRKKTESRLGERVELKNLNSFKFLEKAIDYEFLRQSNLLDSGQSVLRETRGFDPSKEKTYLLRSKEYEADYRYHLDPDLPPLDLLELGKAQPIPCDKIVTTMKNLLDEGINQNMALSILESDPMRVTFHSFLESGWSLDLKSLASWVSNDIQSACGMKSESWVRVRKNAKPIGRSIAKVSSGEVLREEVVKGLLNLLNGPGEFKVQEQTRRLSEDSPEILECMVQLIKGHPDQVKRYKSGQGKVLDFFVGKVLSQFKGQVDPKGLRTKMKVELDAAD